MKKYNRSTQMAGKDMLDACGDSCVEELPHFAMHQYLLLSCSPLSKCTVLSFSHYDGIFRDFASRRYSFSLYCFCTVEFAVCFGVFDSGCVLMSCRFRCACHFILAPNQ